MIKQQITYEDFEKIDLRIGTVVQVEDFPQARKKAYKLVIDFGDEIGVKRSSAQIVKNQTQEDLIGRQVICVVNFAPRQVGPFLSEVLTLGVSDGSEDESNWVILSSFKKVPNGGSIK